MKDFTTPGHIAPIITELMEAHYIVNNPVINSSLDCVGILQKKTSRDAIAIRTPDRGAFSYYTGKAVKKLLKDLDAWTEAAETYPGELHNWNWQEEHRIMEAIRTELINLILKEGEKAS